MSLILYFEFLNLRLHYPKLDFSFTTVMILFISFYLRNPQHLNVISLEDQI